MCASSFLPLHASVDREVCAWTGGAPTSAVSQFLMHIFQLSAEHTFQPGVKPEPKLRIYVLQHYSVPAPWSMMRVGQVA